MKTPTPATISMDEMLAMCQYDITGKSRNAIRCLANSLRKRYGLKGVAVPGRGLRYYPSEVRAKVPIRRTDQ